MCGVCNYNPVAIVVTILSGMLGGVVAYYIYLKVYPFLDPNSFIVLNIYFTCNQVLALAPGADEGGGGDSNAFSTFYGIRQVIKFVTSLDVFTQLSLDCFFPSNHFDKVRIFTLLPIIIFGSVYIILIIFSKRLKIYRNLIDTQVLTTLGFLLPIISSALFDVYRCIDIDPHRELSVKGKWFLIADLSLSCDDGKYREVVSYTSGMLIYPIGFPIMIFYFLYQRRDIIIVPKLRAKVNSVSDMGVVLEGRYSLINVLSSRYLPYRLNFWYWDVIDMCQRLLITSVIKSFFKDINHVIVLSLLVSVFFWRLSYKFQPYEIKVNNTFQHLGKSVIAIMYFCIYILNTELLGSYEPGVENDVMRRYYVLDLVLSVSILLFTAVFVLYMAFGIYKSIKAFQKVRDSVSRDQDEIEKIDADLKRKLGTYNEKLTLDFSDLTSENITSVVISQILRVQAVLLTVCLVRSCDEGYKFDMQKKIKIGIMYEDHVNISKDFCDVFIDMRTRQNVVILKRDNKSGIVHYEEDEMLVQQYNLALFLMDQELNLAKDSFVDGNSSKSLINIGKSRRVVMKDVGGLSPASVSRKNSICSNDISSEGSSEENNFEDNNLSNHVPKVSSYRESHKVSVGNSEIDDNDDYGNNSAASGGGSGGGVVSMPLPNSAKSNHQQKIAPDEPEIDDYVLSDIESSSSSSSGHGVSVKIRTGADLIHKSTSNLPSSSKSLLPLTRPPETEESSAYIDAKSSKLSAVNQVLFDPATTCCICMCTISGNKLNILPSQTCVHKCHASCLLTNALRFSCRFCLGSGLDISKKEVPRTLTDSIRKKSIKTNNSNSNTGGISQKMINYSSRNNLNKLWGSSSDELFESETETDASFDYADYNSVHYESSVEGIVDKNAFAQIASSDNTKKTKVVSKKNLSAKMTMKEIKSISSSSKVFKPKESAQVDAVVVTAYKKLGVTKTTVGNSSFTSSFTSSAISAATVENLSPPAADSFIGNPKTLLKVKSIDLNPSSNLASKPTSKTKSTTLPTPDLHHADLNHTDDGTTKNRSVRTKIVDQLSSNIISSSNKSTSLPLPGPGNIPVKRVKVSNKVDFSKNQKVYLKLHPNAKVENLPIIG